MNNSPRSPLPRRLNGRPAACDACRLRKVGCDHTRPVCNRCRKRGKASACVYSESAMILRSPERGPSFDSTSGAVDTPSSQQQQQSEASPRLNGVPSGPGYMGFTSYSNVFEETRNSLPLHHGSGLDSQRGETPNGFSAPQRISFGSLPAPLRESCLLVLRCLPGQSNEQFQFPSTESSGGGWIDAAMNGIMHGLQNIFGRLLARGEPGLILLAEVLCTNSAKPFRDEHSGPGPWLAQFTGENIRWESLGLVWAHLARVTDIVDSFRERPIAWLTDKHALRNANNCIGYCIDLGRHFTEGNDLIVDLLRRQGTLYSIVDGDATLSTCVAHGAEVAMLTYLGLHDLNNDTSYQPSLCSENKRRLVAQLLTSTGLRTAFTGRPPFITRRYCSTPLPLDLRDEDLVSDPATLLRAAESLDERGWNTDGRLYSTTLIRARCLISSIREEIFEVALSKTVFATLDQLNAIKTRQDIIVSEFPRVLTYHSSDSVDPNVDTTTLFLKLIVRLEELQNRFFIERLCLRFGQQNDGDLLITSFTIVALTVKLWTNKDRFSSHNIRRNFAWLIIAYAAPGGGILCQELLQPTFTGTHPKDPSVSRSSIIQQLSLLVGFLDWVDPSQPNGDLCADSKTIIQQVLDHSLNSIGEPGSIAETPDWGFFNQPDFNFPLLDTFDWLRTDS